MFEARERETLQGSFERILKFAKANLHVRNSYLHPVRTHQHFERIGRRQLEMLEVDDDVRA